MFQVATVCCPFYHLRTQQIFMLQSWCCDKFQENVARITWLRLGCNETNVLVFIGHFQEDTSSTSMPVIDVTHGQSDNDTGNGGFDWPR